MKQSWQIWLGIAVLALFIYAVKAILLPFLVGLAVAYLLDPLADRLEDRKVPRWLAAAMLLVVFFVGVSAILFAIFPLLQAQLVAFAKNLPGYFAAVRPLFEDLWVKVTEAVNLDTSLSSQSVMTEAVNKLISQLGAVLGGFWSGGMALFNLLTLVLISPVVAFFLLRDWDKLIAKVDQLLPRDKGPMIRTVGRDIDAALGGFVRGQTLAALVMASLYAIGWSVAGLEYALVLGLIGGVMAYIPYVGALFTLFLAMLIALGQFGLDATSLLKVAAVYAVVQALEAAVLTPRLVGSHVRLHPVWVLFAIFAGGQLMGFAGVLIAVPVAAVGGVLTRFFTNRYLESQWHEGKSKKGRTKPGTT